MQGSSVLVLVETKEIVDIFYVKRIIQETNAGTLKRLISKLVKLIHGQRSSEFFFFRQ